MFLWLLKNSHTHTHNSAQLNCFTVLIISALIGRTTMALECLMNILSQIHRLPTFMLTHILKVQRLKPFLVVVVLYQFQFKFKVIIILCYINKHFSKALLVTTLLEAKSSLLTLNFHHSSYSGLRQTELVL